MADKINQLLCSTGVKNTGFCSCTFDPKQIVGLLINPKGKTYTKTQFAIANILATLMAVILAPTKLLRMFPFMGFVDFKDNSENAVVATFGYGSSETIRDGVYKWQFMFRKGALNLSNALRSFNGRTDSYDVFLVLSNNVIVGTKLKDASGNEIYGGIPLIDIYTEPFKAADGSKPAEYSTSIVFDPKYVNELVSFNQIDSNVLLLKDLQGLKNMELNVISSTTSTVTLGAYTDCEDNLGETYPTELATQSLWNVTNTATGGAITVTSVVYNASAKGFVVTFDTADTDCPAVGGSISVTLGTPSALNTAGVMLYECVNSVTFTRP